MRVAILEDECVVADRLQRLIREIVPERIESIVLLEDIESAREHLASHGIDVLFLDLDLNGEDGFALLEEAVSSSFATIVVSAHHDQALRAFELGVTDFVPKPFSRERLELSLTRVHSREAALRTALRTLAVRSANRIELIEIGAIQYIRGARDYSALHLEDGRQLLHHKSMSSLECLLPDRFARTHRSYLVDLERIKKLQSHGAGKYTVVLDSGDALPVSRERVAEMRKRLGIQG